MNEDNPFAEHDVLGQRRTQTGVSARRMMQRQIDQISTELEGVMRTTQPLLSQQQRLKEQLALLDSGENAENVPPETLDRLVIFQKEANQVLTEFSTTSPVRRQRNLLDSSPISKARLNATPKNVLNTRRTKPMTTSPRHHEIDLATELGEGLVEEVRRLQAQLYEKDEALRQQIKVKQAEDRGADDLEAKLKGALANEEKLKSLNWELESRAREAEEANRNLIETTSRLEKDLQIASATKEATIEELEMTREAQEETKRELADLRATTSESLIVEKEIQADLRGELASLQANLNHALADLETRKALVAETPLESNLPIKEMDIDDDGDILETPPSSPPQSPIKGTPHRNATLESETMKGTLFYNQSKMLRQRKDLEREKTQRMQLQTEVKDLQAELEELKQQIGSQLPRRRNNRSNEITSKRKPRAKELLELGRRPTSEISMVDSHQDEEFWEEDSDDRQTSLFEAALARTKAIPGSQKDISDCSESDTDVTIQSDKINPHKMRSFSTASVNTIESRVSPFQSSPVRDNLGSDLGSLASASSAASRYTSKPRDLQDELDDLSAIESPSTVRTVSDDLDNYVALLTRPTTREVGTMTDEVLMTEEVVKPSEECELKSWTFVQENPSQYPQAEMRRTAKLTFIHETQETIAQENEILNTSRGSPQPIAPSTSRQAGATDDTSTSRAIVVRVGGRGPLAIPMDPQISYESLQSSGEVIKALVPDGHDATAQSHEKMPSFTAREDVSEAPSTISTNNQDSSSEEHNENSSPGSTEMSALLSTPDKLQSDAMARHSIVESVETEPTVVSPFTSNLWQVSTAEKSNSIDSVVQSSQEETVIVSCTRMEELTKTETLLMLSQQEVKRLQREKLELSEAMLNSRAILSTNEDRLVNVKDVTEHKVGPELVEDLAIAIPGNQHDSKSGDHDTYVDDTDTEDASLATSYRLSQVKEARSSNSSPTAKAEKLLGKSPSLRGMSTSKSISHSLRSQRSNESLRDRSGMAPPVAPSNARDTLRSRQLKSSDHRQSPLKLASRSDLSNVDIAYGTAKIMPPRSYSERSISSLSSFASEIDEHLNPRFDYNESAQTVPRATDPTTIESITRTMIGMSMYKYTRRTGRQDLSDKRHRRYFWIHPYTKTLYWSVYNPVNAPEGAIIKSAPILTVHVESDHNDLPPGLHQRSICIDTPRRMLKLTAVHSTDHEDWVRSLNFLINGPPAVDQAPEARQETDEIIRDFSPTRSPEPSYLASPQKAQAFDSQRTVRAKSSRRSLSGRVNAFFRPPSSYSKASKRTASPTRPSMSISQSDMSIYRPELTLDSISDGFGLENVRECCGGRHDVATLCHRTGGSSRASSRSRR